MVALVTQTLLELYQWNRSGLSLSPSIRSIRIKGTGMEPTSLMAKLGDWVETTAAGSIVEEVHLSHTQEENRENISEEIVIMEKVAMQANLIRLTQAMEGLRIIGSTELIERLADHQNAICVDPYTIGSDNVQDIESLQDKDQQWKRI